ncbi:MAG: tetratricopeptide repeat protein [Aureliella sp.]
MTENTRRRKIEDMLTSEPNDVFLRYSLAMEMVSDGEEEHALELFKTLAEETPPHVPAYFRSAQVLAELDRVSEAREWLRSGIATARSQGDAHAAAEMSEMLADLGELGE